MKIDWSVVRTSVYRSSWFTESWDWLLRLASRASEAVLTVTLIYSTAQIFVATDQRVNLVMFIAQQIALDAGGLGLIKLSNQAKREGNLEGATKARRVAILLMIIMMVGVIVNDVESKISTTAMLKGHQVTLSFALSFPQMAIAIEILLLVIRSIMAVYYGFTIHDLETEDDHQQTSPAPVPSLSPAEIDARIADVVKNQPLPSIDLPAISQQILSQIQPHFQTIFDRISGLESTPKLTEIWPEIEAFFQQKIEQNLSIFSAEIEQKMVLKTSQFLPQNQADFWPKNEPDFDREIEQKSAHFPAENQPDFEPENDPISEEFLAPNLSEILPQKSSKITRELAPKLERNTGPIQAVEKVAEKRSGLTLEEAVKLEICANKKINSRRISKAVSRGEIATFSDGSLKKTSIEKWAKSLEISVQK